MPFKGGTREFSNRYHFNGGTPADDTHWHTLFDAVVAAEKLVHHSTVEIVDVIGYAAGSDVPVSSKTYTTAGTGSGDSDGSFAPGECAILERYTTAARSTKNHPIYLFSYYHHVQVKTGSTGCDLVDPAFVTLHDTYAAAWLTGFSDGTITAVRASPQGAAATGHHTDEYVTHRDFPYTRSV